jgi:hypothetical protein
VLGNVRDRRLPVVAAVQVAPEQASGPEVNAATAHNRCGHGSATT